MFDLRTSRPEGRVARRDVGDVVHEPPHPQARQAPPYGRTFAPEPQQERGLRATEFPPESL